MSAELVCVSAELAVSSAAEPPRAERGSALASASQQQQKERGRGRGETVHGEVELVRVPWGFAGSVDE